MHRGRLALLALLLVGLMAGSWRTMMAPGHTNRAHASFAGSCDNCHLVFDGVPDERCLNCHLAIANREFDGRGFHATVADQACIDCHTDHGGPDGPLTRKSALADFDHGLSGFGLEGRHSTLRCESCHRAPLEAMQPECGECHEDAHTSALGPDCVACHVAQGWRRQLKTLEAHVIETTGGHEGLACEDCHLHGENLDASVVCANCHDQSHGGTQSDCALCHQVSGFAPAEFNHGPCTCSFPGKHQTVECLACHENFSFTDTPTLCSGCHTKDRPHEPLGECSRCHTALSWSDGRFDHDSIRFKIRGAHLSVSCDACHETQFRGVPKACAGCHQEMGDEAHGDFGRCEPCHTTAGFSPSRFDHGSVGFPLTGRHANAPCQSCHAEKVEGYEGR
ncbi:MAG: FAM205/SPATA31 family protein [Myxococcales bacterium]|nr:FAM205/SPATA31 family protein [Myxococcales bacterium]